MRGGAASLLIKAETRATRNPFIRFFNLCLRCLLALSAHVLHEVVCAREDGNLLELQPQTTSQGEDLLIQASQLHLVRGQHSHRL